MKIAQQPGCTPTGRRAQWFHPKTPPPACDDLRNENITKQTSINQPLQCRMVKEKRMGIRTRSEKKSQCPLHQKGIVPGGNGRKGLRDETICPPKQRMAVPVGVIGLYAEPEAATSRLTTGISLGTWRSRSTDFPSVVSRFFLPLPATFHFSFCFLVSRVHRKLHAISPHAAALALSCRWRVPFRLVPVYFIIICVVARRFLLYAAFRSNSAAE